MLDATLRMEFDGREDMVRLFTDPPGLLPGLDPHAVREQLSRLTVGHGDEASARAALDVDYAVISARRRAAASRRA